MRDKINPAVAEVRGDVSAGRLRWTQADVQRLIEPYPKRPKVDAVLAKLEEDTSIPEGECPHEESENESTAPEDSDEQATEDEEADGEAACEEQQYESFAAVAAEPDDVRSSGRDEAADGLPHDVRSSGPTQ